MSAIYLVSRILLLIILHGSVLASSSVAFNERHPGFSVDDAPSGDMSWALVATGGALSWMHVDADGLATWISPLTGSKLWAVARKKPLAKLKRWADAVGEERDKLSPAQREEGDKFRELTESQRRELEVAGDMGSIHAWELNGMAHDPQTHLGPIVGGIYAFEWELIVLEHHSLL